MDTNLTSNTQLPLIRLLNAALDSFSEELSKRLESAGFTDIRPSHGCVFGTIDPQGSRLTDLAHRARHDQAVGWRGDHRSRAPRIS